MLVIHEAGILPRFLSGAYEEARRMVEMALNMIRGDAVHAPELDAVEARIST